MLLQDVNNKTVFKYLAIRIKYFNSIILTKISDTIMFKSLQINFFKMDM